jgi:predicted O-linked N-acetylglucosamine transferase (SPINDLY family)
VGSLSAAANGWVTFGSCNNQAKITDDTVRLWAKILLRVPQSRLLLKYRGMSDPSVTGRLSELFASAGIESQRLEFLGASPHGELLATYNRIDIGLDPFPYSGGLTTCEALWMGVPVVTCPGEIFAARHALTHLSNVDLTETIVADWQAYADVAVSLANDLPRLAAIRATLREQMAGSPLCDGPRFARHLMALLRGVWRQYCSAA